VIRKFIGTPTIIKEESSYSLHSHPWGCRSFPLFTIPVAGQEIYKKIVCNTG
jgi:hypothetical protein